MEAATASTRPAPTIWTEKEKVLRERTVAEMLIKKFSEFDLVESAGASGSYFHFKDHTYSSVYNRTIVQFAGENVAKLKHEAMIYLRQQRHTVEDRSIYGSFVLHLKDIEPMPEGRMFGRSEKPPVEKAPVRNDLQGGLSPSEMVLADPALKRGLDAVKLLHESKLLLGTKNRKAELVFLTGTVPEVAVEYNYIDEAEASYAANLSKEFFEYEPSVRAGNKNSEKVVLRFGLNALKNADFRSLRPKKSRILEGRQIPAVTVARFIVTKMLRLACEIESPPSLENTVFRLGHHGKRQEVIERLDVFGIMYAVDNLDARCFRVRNADMVGTKMTVVQQEPTNNMTTVPISPMSSDESREGRFLVRSVFKEVVGWSSGQQYRIAPDRHANDGTFLYLSVTIEDEFQPLLREKLPEIQTELGERGEATFEGLREGAKSLYFFFPNRASVLLKVEEVGIRQAPSRQKDQLTTPASSMEMPKEKGQPESLALRMLLSVADSLTPDELTILKQKLGITEGLSEEELKEHDRKRDEERDAELEKRFEGHVILDTKEEMVQSMMRGYHPRFFMELQEFLKVKEPA